MAEPPRNLWRKSSKGRSAIMIWLGFFVTTVFVMAIIGLVTNAPKNPPYPLAISIFGAVVASVGLAGWLFIRWLFCWRNFKRLLFGAAGLATVLALFYAEEDWRGWHAWNRFKTEWEAKGEKFDFKDVVPPPVPDDQNFALTPVVASSFEFILDKTGNRISPPKTNVVNRLAMEIYPQHEYDNTNLNSGWWQKAQLTDLERLHKTCSVSGV